MHTFWLVPTYTVLDNRCISDITIGNISFLLYKTNLNVAKGL